MKAYKILPDSAYLDECFVYDEASGVLRWRYRPVSHFRATGRRMAEHIQKMCNTRHAGTVAGSLEMFRGSRYFNVCLDGMKFRAHRIIHKMLTGLDAPEIDHRDNDGINNTPQNLRAATYAQNGQNKRRYRNNESGFKGVKIDKRYGGFIARIKLDGKLTELGKFQTASAAHTAYCEAAQAAFGEFWNPG